MLLEINSSKDGKVLLNTENLLSVEPTKTGVQFRLIGDILIDSHDSYERVKSKLGIINTVEPKEDYMLESGFRTFNLREV
ncbi:MAG: hypothetical protein HN509_03450 [Halobacteriovoraceae bacterium]|jgi:hypothetical protein|nr:hypothetical protein [Halobacteriovoraceae bacterium]MBT5093221.1 hypothetical protein [Halobacteriovoraceae bacterium]